MADDQIIRRLEALEADQSRLRSSIHRWRTIAAFACLATAIVTLSGAGSSLLPGVLEASQFILKDQEGRTRAALEFSPKGDPSLVLLDAQSKKRLWLGLDEGSPTLRMFDPDMNSPRLNLFRQPKGGMGLSMQEEGSETRRVFLGMRPDGNDALRFMDGLRTRLFLGRTAANSTVLHFDEHAGSIKIEASPDGSSNGVGFYDDRQRLRLGMGHRSGVSSLVYADSEGKDRLNLETSAPGQPTIRLLDRNGKFRIVADENSP